MSTMGQDSLISMKVPQLREMLKSKGLITTGKKHVLIERLQSGMDSSNAKNETKTQSQNTRDLKNLPSPTLSFSDWDTYSNNNDDFHDDYLPNVDDEYQENSCCKRYANNQDLMDIINTVVQSRISEFAEDLGKKFTELGGAIEKALESESKIESEKFAHLNTQCAAYEKRIAQLELKNAQLENMVSELVKGSLDYEHERSNVVLYGVEKSEIEDYRSRNGNEKRAVDNFALNFVRKYLPEYEASDIKARILRDNSLMISMACSADAFRLTKRCRQNGVTRLKQGLTKPERLISKEVSLKTTQLNSNLDNTSEKIYKKRYVHSIVKIKKHHPRNPLATFIPEFNLSNLNGHVMFKATGTLRKVDTRVNYNDHNPPDNCF